MEIKRRDIIRILRSHGCIETRRGKGSHSLWEFRDPTGRTLATRTIPGHRDIDELLWRKIERDLREH